MLKRLVLVFLAFLFTMPAFAASDDAWAEFAADVERSCLQATSALLRNAQVIVDPFGSESYGLAMVRGEVGEGQVATVICVFDKQTKAVQIGGELDISVTENSNLT